MTEKEKDKKPKTGEGAINNFDGNIEENYAFSILTISRIYFIMNYVFVYSDKEAAIKRRDDIAGNKISRAGCVG
ncbi:MAG: hypothetical protein MSJ26_00865 [Oscillospiraceae bacterium]|nr:hypothetical protein [Oscillospiraceae bacterium]